MYCIIGRFRKEKKFSFTLRTSLVPELSFLNPKLVSSRIKSHNSFQEFKFQDDEFSNFICEITFLDFIIF